MSEALPSFEELVDAIERIQAGGGDHAGAALDTLANGLLQGYFHALALSLQNAVASQQEGYVLAHATVIKGVVAILGAKRPAAASTLEDQIRDLGSVAAARSATAGTGARHREREE